jgi:hypothetical protein
VKGYKTRHVFNSKYKLPTSAHVQSCTLEKAHTSVRNVGFVLVFLSLAATIIMSTTTTATKMVEGRLQLSTRRVRLAPPPHPRTEGSGATRMPEATPRARQNTPQLAGKQCSLDCAACCRLQVCACARLPWGSGHPHLLTLFKAHFKYH